MQDTSGYVLYRTPPPICIGTPPAPQAEALAVPCREEPDQVGVGEGSLRVLKSDFQSGNAGNLYTPSDCADPTLEGMKGECERGPNPKEA